MPAIGPIAAPQTTTRTAATACFSRFRHYLTGEGDAIAGTESGSMTTLSSYGKKVRLGKNMRASLAYAARTPDRWHAGTT